MQTETELGTLVQEAADQLVGRHVGVAVGAIRGDEVVVRGAGRSGRPGTAGPPDGDTLFEIGSVSKVFTSLLLARRVVDGVVGLDEPVRELLPPGTAVPTRDGKEITLRHLATHTSGLPRLPHGLLKPWMLVRTPIDPYAGCTAEVILDGLARTKLRSVPGQKWRYSNLGASLLGLALSLRAGTDYEALLIAEVCHPLGLCDTSVAVDERRFAQGHTRGRKPTPPWNLNALAGAGGLRSTVPDLIRFLRAQLDPEGTPLAEAIRLTRTTEHRMNKRAWMHLGWVGMRSPDRLNTGPMLWHDGGTGGFRSLLGLIPEAGTGVVVLSNTARFVNRPGLALISKVTESTRE